MRGPQLGDIDIEEFREHGHQVVEWIASYLYRPTGIDDEASLAQAALLEAVDAAGTVYLSRTVLRGVCALRLAVGNLRTTDDRMAAAWDAVQEAGYKLPAP